MRLFTLVLIAAVAGALTAGPAGAVHEMRVTSHTRIGIRFRWRGTCEHGSALRIARFRNVPVSRDGAFFRRNRFGVGVRGKIGFDPLGNPVFPAPFSFANNEAKGRLRAVVALPDRGVCRSGLVSWEARR